MIADSGQVNAAADQITAVIQSRHRAGSVYKASTLVGILSIMNSIADPDNIKPETKEFSANGKQIEFIAKPYSLNVIKVKFK